MSTSHVPSKFHNLIHDVSTVMKLYIMHIKLRRVEGEVFHFPYNTHTIVTALELLFYCDLSRVSGAYLDHEIVIVKNGDSEVLKPVLSLKTHSWLSFKEDKRYIIDVIPVHWMKEKSFTSPVFLYDHPYRYQTSRDLDPRHWTPLQKKKMHEDVNKLASLFEGFLPKVLKVK